MFARLKRKIRRKIQSVLGCSECLASLNSLERNIESRLIDIGQRLRAADDFEAFIQSLSSIRLEVTNKCNYHCPMCPHDAMTRPKGFLSLEDLDWMLKNISAFRPEYDGDVNLQGSGEPLLDKDLPAKVALIKRHLPKSQVWIITTLGVRRQQKWFESLIEAGLDKIAVSCYGYDRGSYHCAHGLDNFELVMLNCDILSEVNKEYGIEISYKGMFSNYPGVEIAEKFKFLLEPLDCDAYDSFKQKMVNRGFIFTNSCLDNYGAGNITNLERPLRPCSVHNGKLSRVLQIDWDGRVIPCCRITNQEIILGDLRTQSLREICGGGAWLDFKRAHQRLDLREAYPYCWRCLQDASHWDKFTP